MFGSFTEPFNYTKLSPFNGHFPDGSGLADSSILDFIGARVTEVVNN